MGEAPCRPAHPPAHPPPQHFSPGSWLFPFPPCRAHLCHSSARSLLDMASQLITTPRVRVVLVLGCFALSKSVDWTKPEHWAILRSVFIGSLLLCLACFAQLHQSVNNRNERRKTVKVSNKADDGCALFRTMHAIRMSRVVVADARAPFESPPFPFQEPHRGGGHVPRLRFAATVKARVHHADGAMDEAQAGLPRGTERVGETN